MTHGHLLLLLLFLLTVGHLVTLKICSLKLDHRTAPLFIGGWTLAGLATVYPLYAGLLAEGLEKFAANPLLPALAAVKGALLCYLFVISQELMKVSLSSRHYVTPLSLGLITIGNAAFGESLKPQEWFSSIGLCLLAAAFFLRGHLADLSPRDRLSYAKLVGISGGISVIDHIITKDANWYILSIAAYAVVFIVAIAWNFRRMENFRTAALTRPAVLAGVTYAATELVKAYQQVTINPVTVVVTVQAMTKPVILVLSAYLWKERTVKEQLARGCAAFVITLPLFLWDDIVALWH